MAAVTTAPGIPSFRLHSDSDLVTTLPDPRSRSGTPSTPVRNGSATPTHHPDLSNEVAMLSNKLIDAINHQTNLDDTLADTRHELGAARTQISQLEARAQEQAEMIASGVLVQRSEVERQRSNLLQAVEDEKTKRNAVEKEKKEIEQELESLTGALFEEANKMVAAARKERDAVEKKNEQLKSQLNEKELLLASHQEQLTELKSVLQQMGSERDEMETNTNISTAPSTPALGTRDSKENLEKVFEALHLSPNTPGTSDVPPACPTSFSHLVHPVLRHDLHAYEDFGSLLRMGRQSAPSSRVNSGSYGGLNVMGLGSLSQHNSVIIPANNGSSSSLSTVATLNSTPTTPITPASSVSNGSARDVPDPLVPLKETRFYKRALVEDIEPTLRLDTAPGLSWLARRTVLTSIAEGNLIVEPSPALHRLYMSPCSLCGEKRKDEEHARNYRFRTSDKDKNGQAYPLCGYCLGRMRAACDFLGFLRMVRDGYWRTEGEEGIKGAWEESVRLRERMFWARMGGGVVPAFLNVREASPRSSEADERSRSLENARRSKELEEKETEREKLTVEDPFKSFVKRVSIGKTVLTAEQKSELRAVDDPSEIDKQKALPDTPKDKETFVDVQEEIPGTFPSAAQAKDPTSEPSRQENIDPSGGRDSLRSDSSATMTPGSRRSSLMGADRLSISIPSS